MNKKEIEKIKEILTGSLTHDLSDDPELESIRKLKKVTSIDDVKLGILFLKCYNFMKSNLFLFKEEDNDYTEHVINYLKTFNVIGIRNFISNYKNGKEYGDAIIEQNIKFEVEKNRDKFEELLRFFFEIFGADD